jgi:hypothetical protein
MLIEKIITGVFAALLIKAILVDFPMYLVPASFKKYLKYALGSVYIFGFMFGVSYFYSIPSTYTLYLIVFIVVLLPGIYFYLK